MRKRYIAVGVGVILALTASVRLTLSERRGDFYPETAIVREVSATTDLVVVETCTGNLFTFRGTEDWEVGDSVSMIMDSRATDTVEDDEIVSTKYAGWKLGG